MVRIWNVPVEILDRQHLLGEHVELHVIFSAILRGSGGYYNHPQTNKFKGKLDELTYRHNQQVAEMSKRGYHHKSPLPVKFTPKHYKIESKDYLADFKVLEERNGLLK